MPVIQRAPPRAAHIYTLFISVGRKPLRDRAVSASLLPHVPHLRIGGAWGNSTTSAASPTSSHLLYVRESTSLAEILKTESFCFNIHVA